MKIFKNIKREFNNKKTKKELNKNLCKMRELKVEVEESGNPTYKKIMEEMFEMFNDQTCKAYDPYIKMLENEMRAYSRMYDDAVQRGEDENILSRLDGMIKEVEVNYQKAIKERNLYLI